MAAEEPEQPTLLEDLPIQPQAIAQFDYEGGTYPIWESIVNKAAKAENPAQWQFRYDPLFLPEMSSSGKPNIQIVDAPQGLFRVVMPIHLTTDKAKAQAFMTVKNAFSSNQNYANQIIPSNVSVLDIRSIEVKIDQLANMPGVKVHEKRMSFAHTPNTFLVNIDAQNKATAEAVAKVLPNLIIEYTYRYGAKRIQENVVTVKFSDMKNTKLFAALNGLGTNETYVHRDDLRKLVDNSSSELAIVAQLEAPEKFDSILFKDILEKMTAKQNMTSAAFDAQKLKSTYNAADLTPDAVTKSLNKIFKKNEAKDQWENAGSHDVSGNTNFIDLFNAGASSKGTHTTKGLKELLEQHDIHVEIEGNKIVAKSIDLRQVNMSSFDNAQKLTNQTMLVASAIQSKSGHFDLASLSNKSASDTGLTGKVASLKNEIAPIGSILAFAGSVGPSTTLPYNWRLCDGAPLNKNQYPALWNAIGSFWGSEGDTFRLPDLRGQFLRGVDLGAKVDPEGENRLLGSRQGHAIESHSHPATAAVKPKIHNQKGEFMGGNFIVTQQPRNLSETEQGLVGGGFFQDGVQTGLSRAALEVDVTVNNSSASKETRPTNSAVHWIIRVE